MQHTTTVKYKIEVHITKHTFFGGVLNEQQMGTPYQRILSPRGNGERLQNRPVSAQSDTSNPGPMDM